MYIKDGDYVVFDEHGDKKALVHIKPNGYVSVAAAGGWNMQGPSTCYKPSAQHNKAATPHNSCNPSSGHKIYIHPEVAFHRRAKVGKSYITTGDLIGARWGSTYTLSAGSSRLVPVTE